MASPSLGFTHKRYTPIDLQQKPFITLSKGSILFKIINDWFNSEGSGRSGVYTCRSIHVAGNLARRGLGVALLPARLYAQDIKRKKLSVIQVNPPLRPLQFFCDNFHQQP